MSRRVRAEKLASCDGPQLYKLRLKGCPFIRNLKQFRLVLFLGCTYFLTLRVRFLGLGPSRTHLAGLPAKVNEPFVGYPNQSGLLQITLQVTIARLELAKLRRSPPLVTSGGEQVSPRNIPLQVFTQSRARHHLIGKDQITVPIGFTLQAPSCAVFSPLLVSAFYRGAPNGLGLLMLCKHNMPPGASTMMCLHTTIERSTLLSPVIANFPNPPLRFSLGEGETFGFTTYQSSFRKTAPKDRSHSTLPKSVRLSCSNYVVTLPSVRNQRIRNN